MKRFISKLSIFAIAFIFTTALTLGTSTKEAQAQGYGSIGYQDFYDDLAPYGQWFNDPQYGYVWTPHGVGNNFRPYYTNGYWAMTEYGNMWMSNYAWGWAPFHYGRWALTNYGWVWIPGNEWGPAWVTWRQGGGYYGWAPMGPGISINISFGNSYYAPDPWWTFIPCNYIYNRGFHRYHNPRRNNTYIHNTTIINNTYYDNRSRNTYVTGPRRNEVERVTGRRVDVYQVNNRSRAGRHERKGNAVSVYRPSIERNSRTQKSAVPRSVKQIDRNNESSRQNVRTRQQNNRNEIRQQENTNRRANSNQAVENRSRQNEIRQQQRNQTERQQQQQRQQIKRQSIQKNQQIDRKEQNRQTRQRVQQGQKAERQSAQRQQVNRRQSSQSRQQVQRQQRQSVQRSTPSRQQKVSPSRSTQRSSADHSTRSSHQRSDRNRR